MALPLFEAEPRVDYYRVQGRWVWPNPYCVGYQRTRFVPDAWWKRTHQAEWDGCKEAVRAYTKWGVKRKAERAVRRWMDW